MSPQADTQIQMVKTLGLTWLDRHFRVSGPIASGSLLESGPCLCDLWKRLCLPDKNRCLHFHSQHTTYGLWSGTVYQAIGLSGTWTVSRSEWGPVPMDGLSCLQDKKSSLYILPEQNDIFKCIFINEICHIFLIQISQKFASMCLIGNESASVQVMAWCRSSVKL